MASEILIKRLLTRAGVSVLAGLLVSSAVLAEDTTDGGAISTEVEVSIDDVADGTGTIEDPGSIDDGVTIGEEGTGEEGSGEDGEITIDPIEVGDPIDMPCDECDGGGLPDVSIDPIEMDGSEVIGIEGDLPVEAYQNMAPTGEETAAPQPRGDVVSHERGRGRDGDLPPLRLLIVE